MMIFRSLLSTTNDNASGSSDRQIALSSCTHHQYSDNSQINREEGLVAMTEDEEFEKHIAGNYPDRRLSQEVGAACQIVFDLMKSPEGDVHHFGYSKPQKVTLTLPQAFVQFAVYRALFEQAKGGGPLWQDFIEGDRKPGDKKLVRIRNRFLEDVLVKFLDNEFDGFATLTHPLLFPESESTDEKPGRGY